MIWSLLSLLASFIYSTNIYWILCHICQVLCWVTNIWDLLSNWLYICPEYVFHTFRSTFTFRTLLMPWEVDLFWTPSMGSLHALMFGLANKRHHQQEIQEQEERWLSPCWYSPWVFVISPALCSFLLLLTYSLLVSSLSTFIFSLASLKGYGTCFVWNPNWFTTDNLIGSAVNEFCFCTRSFSWS